MRPDTEVLFVEDDAGDRELVERALRRVARPGRWAIVGSVAEAKDYLNRAGVFEGAAEPHLIVLDMNARKRGRHCQRSHLASCERFAAFLQRSPEMATA
ncbi:MAG TPA: hypothetical protein VFO36_01275, partial [Nitrospiraceae bacterium]|nr:hypothetical protein [Nitrospiraceae bacterium]